MPFFEFNQQCDIFLGTLPLLPASVGWFIFCWALPIFFHVYERETSVKKKVVYDATNVVSISETWRCKGSILSVHLYAIFIAVFYVGFCSNDIAFRIVVSFLVLLLLCIFWINADLDNDDNLYPNYTKEQRLKFINNHFKLALSLFVFLLVACTLIIQFNIGWASSSISNQYRRDITYIVTMMYVLFIVCGLAMLVIAINQKMLKYNEVWRNSTSSFEHAYANLFWIIIAFVTNES